MSEGEQTNLETESEEANASWLTRMGVAMSKRLSVVGSVSTLPASEPLAESSNEPPNPTSWLAAATSFFPWLPFKEDDKVEVNSLTNYSKLTSKQIQLLEFEALQGIFKKNNSWCWFETVSLDGKVTQPDVVSGVLSVANTSSLMCPLPLKKFPFVDDTSRKVFISNSIILPNSFPEEVFHERSFLNTISTAFKKHYNFPNEEHTYLKKQPHDVLEGKRVILISFAGLLPDRYEKITLSKGFSAKDLSAKVAKSLRSKNPAEIVSLSLECPLDQKSLELCAQECIQLLNNWRSELQKADAIFFAGIYHSVPISIIVAQQILEKRDIFQNAQNKIIGILGIESCLRGYRFWDHSSDIYTGSETSNFQSNREKLLYQGCTKQQQETLSQLANYRLLNSKESEQVQKALDHLLFHYRNLKVVLTGKLYDNFMTIAQKLAIEYQHPNILRHIWCDGNHLGLDLRKDVSGLLFNNKKPQFESSIGIPKDRYFETQLISNLLLAISLGKHEFIPMFKLISPFYISRSFNENTIPANIKKQQQGDLKGWMQEMDTKWKDSEIPVNSMAPNSVHDIHEFLEFIYYKCQKDPDFVKIEGGMYEDDTLYQGFLEDVLETVPLLEAKHLHISMDHSTPSSILDNQNQYDLVWRLHECLSSFTKMKNVPEQAVQEIKMRLFIKDQNTLPVVMNPTKTKFHRNNKEALARLRELWESYRVWNPPTRGLKQLRRILSFLSLYSSYLELQYDVHHRT
ncbi:LAFE_0E09340g1_1 [Lachancea fermentati]|uniref:LAFE_0E09340g1_1 n=1 Tax=Lachancea fermentati TaxID=4955 RepID=A0A1G4MDB6_LACFM|nr:LAFE_0E09340g1_1 [Lachancea fermentati]